MRGSDFLEIPARLANYEDEVTDRTVIGRLYYAVYLEYRQFFEDRQLFVRQGMSREHAAINNLLKANNPAVADDLWQLRQNRNRADYDLLVSQEEMKALRESSEHLAVDFLDFLAAMTHS